MNNLTVQRNRRNDVYALIPLIGSILFVILYIFATFLYPGGSQIDKNSKGFSWINNYWCNLLNENAMNGEVNPARPIAITAMLVLCLTLSYFWYQFPVWMNFKKTTRLTMQIAGILSMLFAMFLFTSFHDQTINIAGIFGLIALTGTYIGLYKRNWGKLFWSGIFNLVLVLLNNYIYYTKELLIHLPVVQKISFLSFLLWICLIDIEIWKLSKFKSSHQNFLF